jgi:hypothetical protein
MKERIVVGIVRNGELVSLETKAGSLLPCQHGRIDHIESQWLCLDCWEFLESIDDGSDNTWAGQLREAGFDTSGRL